MLEIENLLSIVREMMKRSSRASADPTGNRRLLEIENLLSIVREMMRRHDRNAVPLLEIITEECLQCDQVRGTVDGGGRGMEEVSVNLCMIARISIG